MTFPERPPVRMRGREPSGEDDGTRLWVYSSAFEVEQRTTPTPHTERDPSLCAVGDGFTGLPDCGPFDAIHVGAAVPGLLILFSYHCPPPAPASLPPPPKKMVSSVGGTNVEFSRPVRQRSLSPSHRCELFARMSV